MSRIFRSSLAGFALLFVASTASASPILSVSPSLSSASVGQTVNVDIILDTDGRTLEGYAFSVEFSAAVSSVSHTGATLPPLSADLFGPATYDSVTRVFANLNQASFAGFVAAGSFVIETLSFVVEEAGDLVITPLLRPGESLGLDGSACPGPGCPGDSPMATSGTIQVSAVPEPSVVWLAAAAVLAGAASRRRV